MNKIAQISAKIGGGVALSLFSLANIAPADAAILDLTQGTGPGDPAVSTFSVTGGGVTATFTDADGGSNLARDGRGLRVYGTSAFGGGLVTPSIDITFNQNVILNGYEVTDATNLEGDETIIVTVACGTVDEFEEGPFTTGVKTFVNQVFVAAGEIVTLTYGGQGLPSDDNENLFWNNLEVTPVPEPASLVGLLGVGALGFASRKRK